MKSFLFVCSILLLVLGCSSPPQNEITSDAITIEVFLTKVGDTSYIQGQRIQTDTIGPGDTVILQARVLPSANATLEYGWKVDGVSRPYEFTISKVFSLGGLHRPVFHVVDAFGDTLSDTLTIWVNHPPHIDSLISPIDSAIITTMPIPFRWSTVDEDPNPGLVQGIEIFRESSAGWTSYASGVVRESFSEWDTELSELESWRWRIVAYDTIGAADTSDWRYFTTGSQGLAGRILGVWQPRASAAKAAQVTLSGNGILPRSLEMNTTSNHFDFGSLFPGIYTLRATIVSTENEYAIDERTIILFDDEIEQVVVSPSDTLAPRLTVTPDSALAVSPSQLALQFHIQEKASGLDLTSLRFSVDGTSSLSYTLSGDSLLQYSYPGVALEGRHSFALTVLDKSGNSSTINWHLDVSR